LESQPTTLLPGTLDLLVLNSLGAGEMHGSRSSRRIQRITGGTFVAKPGSLFPALHRMQEEGWMASFWRDSKNNRRAKYYRLTKAGFKQTRSANQQMGTYFLGDGTGSRSVVGGVWHAALCEGSKSPAKSLFLSSC
jgi:PadR family transcriptional regulator